MNTTGIVDVVMDIRIAIQTWTHTYDNLHAHTHHTHVHPPTHTNLTICESPCAVSVGLAISETTYKHPSPGNVIACVANALGLVLSWLPEGQ